MDYEDGDIFEVFDVDEWWTFTRGIGDEVADFFSDCESVDRDDFQQAIDEICDELGRVIFDEAYDVLRKNGIDVVE